MKKYFMFMFYLLLAVPLIFCTCSKNGRKNGSTLLLKQQSEDSKIDLAHQVQGTPTSTLNQVPVSVSTPLFTIQLININGDTFTFRIKNDDDDKNVDVTLQLNTSVSKDSIIDNKSVVFKRSIKTIEISIPGVSGSFVLFMHVPSQSADISIIDASNRLSYQFR
jgi:hypothetical protein